MAAGDDAHNTLAELPLRKAAPMRREAPEISFIRGGPGRLPPEPYATRLRRRQLLLVVNVSALRWHNLSRPAKVCFSRDRF